MLRPLALLTCLAASAVVQAEVVSVEVASRQAWADGRAFGAVGAYEVLRGTVHYAIDPRSASARNVTDIRHAPVNARGLVEYSGPFLVIRPVDAARGNHTTLVEVANRGNTQMNGLFFRTGSGFDLMAATPAATLTESTFFELGYTVAWVGWQAKLKREQFGLQVPVANVHGPVRATFGTRDMTPDRRAYDLAQNGYYCARDAAQPKAVLRTQTSFDDPGQVVARSAWRFAAADDGAPGSAACRIEIDGVPATGYSHFSLVYEGEKPAVAGLGQAAFRDFAWHLRDRRVPSELNQRPQDAKAVLAYGYSQGGRFLRDSFYGGSNTGPGGIKLYDGMLVTAAGA
ncbi:MAG: hypothetical protein K0M70_03820, partial [Arenimonas sp.]|uniref:alpha/beta hydrolase domain-containing protein n=1 Tax=Arenimonas sp. TaxID=1872635 RepID=UPI0025C58C3E